MKKNSFGKRLKYILEYVVIRLSMFSLQIMGLERSARFYGWIAQTFAEKVLRKARRARENMKICFPEKSDEEINQIMNKMWDAMVRIPIEYNFPWKYQAGIDSKFIEVDGIEHLHDFMNDEKPGIIVTGHIGNWQMITFVAKALGYDIYQLYRQSNNPYFDKIERKCQEIATAGVITKGKEGAKDLIEILEHGKHIMLLMDQRFGSGPKLPFLGRPATTATGPIRLALKHGARLMPARSIRKPDGLGFKVTYYPPIDLKASKDINGDAEKIMTKVNDVLSGWIKEYPEQWMWIHDRWK